MRSAFRIITLTLLILPTIAPVASADYLCTLTDAYGRGKYEGSGADKDAAKRAAFAACNKARTALESVAKCSPNAIHALVCDVKGEITYACHLTDAYGRNQYAGTGKTCESAKTSAYNTCEKDRGWYESVAKCRSPRDLTCDHGCK